MAFMQVTDAAKREYESVHWGRLQAVALGIVSDSTCDVTNVFAQPDGHSGSEADMAERWHQVVATLPGDQCVFLIANFGYVAASDQVQRAKVVFVTWCPSAAPAKQKMLSAFCTQAIVSQCGSGGGIAARLQAATPDALHYDAVREKLLRTSTIK